MLSAPCRALARRILRQTRPHMAKPPPTLSEFGYKYVENPNGSGNRHDLVLRTSDESSGFIWKGQENYDQVGDAVVSEVQAYLTKSYGLEEKSLGDAPPFATVYATPDFESQAGPLLILVCGFAPGGAAGVWGRSLCINGSLLEG